MNSVTVTSPSEGVYRVCHNDFKNFCVVVSQKPKKVFDQEGYVLVKGPWTVTPLPGRHMALSELQAYTACLSVADGLVRGLSASKEESAPTS